MEQLSHLEQRQQAILEKRERDRRLGKIPSATVIRFGERAAFVADPAPEDVPLATDAPPEDTPQDRRDRLNKIESDLRELMRCVKAEIANLEVGEPRKVCPPIHKIQRCTAKFYDIPVFEMKSNRRTKNIIRPRQIAMFLAKELTLRSMPDIASHFGGRDHTTVLHSVRKIARLINSDPSLAGDIAQLKAQIDPQMEGSNG